MINWRLSGVKFATHANLCLNDSKLPYCNSIFVGKEKKENQVFMRIGLQGLAVLIKVLMA